MRRYFALCVYSRGVTVGCASVALTVGDVSEIMPYFALCVCSVNETRTVSKTSICNVTSHGCCSACHHESKPLFGTPTELGTVDATVHRPQGVSESPVPNCHTQTHKVSIVKSVHLSIYPSIHLSIWFMPSTIKGEKKEWPCDTPPLCYARNWFRCFLFWFFFFNRGYRHLCTFGIQP